ncbi:hypothetical protein F4825DRAFT_446643 [Nemania diffusa]|nr:hypothetical protein F4825DRAFT_446643 [Nemania diffusa]
MTTQTRPATAIIHGARHVPKNHDKLATTEVDAPLMPSADKAGPLNADLASDTVAAILHAPDEPPTDPFYGRGAAQGPEGGPKDADLERHYSAFAPSYGSCTSEAITRGSLDAGMKLITV